MATVEIENGQVRKIIEGYGFKVSEEIRLKNGESATRWYTVWTRDKFEVGDQLRIKGDLSVKLEEYTGRDNKPATGLSVNINNAVCSVALDAPF